MAELRYHEWNVDKAIKINGSRSWSELIEQAFRVQSFNARKLKAY